MGKTAPITFGTSTDKGREGQDSGPVLINAEVEPTRESGFQAPIYADAGMTTHKINTGLGVVRGGIVVDDVLYVLVGTTVLKVFPSNRVVTVGTIAGTNRAMFARNDAATVQIAIVLEDGTKYYIASNAINTISDADLPAASSVTYLNQKIIYGIADGRFFWSAVGDLTDISALDFATAEGNPDGNLRTIAHLQEIWIFGQDSIEIWYDDGSGFSRRSGTVIPKGCIGGFTVAQLDKDIFWVGNDSVVYMATGYGFQRISGHHLESLIRAVADKSTLLGWTYFHGGHAYYVLKCADWTWRFNRTYGNWTIKKSYGLNVWQAEYGFEMDNEWYFASNQNDAIFKASDTHHKEGDDELVWTVQSPPLHAYPNQLSVHRLYLDMITGVGKQSTDAHQASPVVGMRYSDDGGYTWSNQRQKSIGAKGTRNFQVVFDGLGETGVGGRIWEISSSNPVIRGLKQASIEAEPSGN